jgi:signal transduction histidine kinase
MPTEGRSRRIGIAVAVAAAVVFVNLMLWLVYRDSRRGLEAELSRRLESVVAVLGELLEPGLVEQARQAVAADSLGEWTGGAAAAHDSLRALLRRVAEASELANVRVLDHDGVPFLEVVGLGRELAPEALDPAAVQAALTGATVHGDLYASGRDMLMAGYAPVRDAAGTVRAAVAVEADARLFEAVARLRVAMIASAIVSAAALVALGLAFARLQTSLQRAQAAAQRAETLAAMGRMTAGIAHEIRNPLGIVKATAARLKKRYDDPAQPDERFDYITEEVDRLDGILTGYLQFARDTPAPLAPLDLGEVVQRSLRVAAPELEASGVRLELDAPPGCTVLGDAQRLQQVVLNLVLNAAQAIPAGGRVHVRLGRDGAHTVLLVDDDGPGFPAGGRERWFEPFVTTREQGSGLGLAVARRIVEQHGGRIVLGDAPGGGARVEVRVPSA